MRGELRRAGAAGYQGAARLFDPRFDHIAPTAVATVADDHDVAHCVSFAQRFGLPISIRSGGHSYLGASTGTGLVIDVRGVSAVVNNGDGTATIGAGAALIDVYSKLAADGLSIPAGSCPSVGLSGHALGGGVGVVTRQYGLTCDRLAVARIVTAAGESLNCNESAHSDLFWALRGGGGSFGVVTELTLRTVPADPIAHGYLVWPWPAAAEVMTAWQRWAPSAPNALWSSCHILATNRRPDVPTISVPAVMVGSTAALAAEIDALVAAVPTAPTTRFVATESWQNTMLLEAGCADLSLEACHVGAETPGGALPRSAFIAGSDYFRHEIPAAGVAAIVAAVAERQADPRLSNGGVSFDCLGGAVDDLAPEATAYVHRGALFNAQYTASWNGSGNGPLRRNQRSLTRLKESVRSYATGQAYQNYADSLLADPQQAYYATNLPRLIATRRSYDPRGVFTQPQGVPLEPVP
jgi:FAD/FMN-containing dehydrogenase